MFGVKYFHIYHRIFQKITIEEAKNLILIGTEDVYATDNFNEVIPMSNLVEIEFFSTLKFYFAQEIPFLPQV